MKLNLILRFVFELMQASLMLNLGFESLFTFFMIKSGYIIQYFLMFIECYDAQMYFVRLLVYQRFHVCSRF